jgi:hypothetical protein
MESSNFIAKASCRPVLMPRIVLTILLFIETAPVGRKGAFESPSLIRKRNQTNQLQTKLLTSGPGGRRFKSSLPDHLFSHGLCALPWRHLAVTQSHQSRVRWVQMVLGGSAIPP